VNEIDQPLYGVHSLEKTDNYSLPTCASLRSRRSRYAATLCRLPHEAMLHHLR